jgi:hypothetical protein
MELVMGGGVGEGKSDYMDCIRSQKYFKLNKEIVCLLKLSPEVAGYFSQRLFVCVNELFNFC